MDNLGSTQAAIEQRDGVCALLEHLQIGAASISLESFYDGILRNAPRKD
jgi:hypothetical protein